MSFWQSLPRPIVALSPMDGVTDVVARSIACRHGGSPLTMTEFVPVEGLVRGAVRLLDDFLYDPAYRPVVAQVYGTELSSFREVAAICCALGFDGIDVNMGCPAPTVAERGAGAALIRTPDLARKIIRAVRAGVEDWANGGSLERLVGHPKVRRAVAERARMVAIDTRRRIPVSVKTRVGFDSVVADRWIQELAAEGPATISVHGRTLKQLYSGKAAWDVIGSAAEKISGSGILVLGNGDVTDRADAEQRVEEYGLDGALIGRATIGNPWALSGQVVSVQERLVTAIEHAEEFERRLPEKPFVAARKHLHGYCRGFDGAPELRRQLMLAPNSAYCRLLIDRALIPLAA